MKKGRKIAGVLGILLLGILAIGCGKEEETKKIESVKPEVTEQEAEIPKPEAPKQETEETAYVLDGNIEVSGFGKYMGSYVEDGTDEYVENVMKIVLENRGQTYLQSAAVTINDRYVFEITSLFPGETVMVLEKNRSAYEEGMEITSADIENAAIFHEAPTMCEDILKIDVEGSLFTISNVGENGFPGGKLFFKNKLKDQYLGGITYFITLPELAQGQEIQLSSAHFQEGDSELLFVTYAE